VSTPADRIRRALGFCHRRFWSQKVKELVADHNNDHNAALRLCALKVAAMIGEGM